MFGRRLMAASVLIAAFGLVACSQEELITGSVSEVFVAEDLDSLAANSDLIVEGTVESIEPGRIMVEDPLAQFSQVTLRVDRVLFGEAPSDRLFVEEGWWGFPPASEEGQTGIYFLHLKLDPTDIPYYRLTSSQGRFLFSEGRVVASNTEEEWASHLERLTPDEFRGRVEETVSDASPSPSPDKDND